MKSRTITLIVVLVVIALVIIGLLVWQNRQAEPEVVTDNQPVVVEELVPAEEESEIEEEEEPIVTPAEELEDVTFTGQVLAGDSSPLLDFNQADLDTALATNKLVVLYFYASWCSICQAEIKEAIAAFNELTSDRVVGFRVNYNDSDTDSNEKKLASEHGVAYQHTKVFVRNGERILKAPDSWDKDKFVTEIRKQFQ